MKNIILTGATGMIGGIVQRECLNSPEVAQVTSIIRKPSGVKHPKLVEVIHKDFMDYSGLEKHFQNQDIAHFCIGVYTGQVPDDKFKMITVDFVKVFADMLKEQSPQVTFCLLSGAGADQKEKSRTAFARYKGMAENYLISKNFKSFYSFRPAYIYPVEKRKEPNLMYSISRSLYPLLKNVYSKGVITSEQLGQGMVKAGLNGASKMILENEDIKAL